MAERRSPQSGTAVDLEQARRRIETELPRRVRWLIHDTPLDFDFSRAQHPLEPTSESDLQGTMKEEWTTLYLFGEQDYARGGGAAPYLGIDAVTGAVRGLDVESSRLFLLNSDIGAFVETFQLFDQALRLRSSPLDAVASVARRIDPPAFEQSEWSELVAYLLDGERG